MSQMATNSDAKPFDRALMQLIHLSDCVELRKRWCSKVCHDCQQLIRPWPRRFGLAATEEQQTSQGKSKEGDSSGDCPTPAELEHLRLIEEALRKAGKTRQVAQAKLESAKVFPKTAANETVTQSNFPAEGDLLHSSGDAQVKTFDSRAIPSESSTRQLGSLSLRERNHSLPDIGSSYAQKSRPGQVNTDVRIASDVAVISQTALDGLRTSALARSKSSRSLVAAEKASATGSSVRYKPAHVTAPFLTTAQTRSGSRMSSGRQTYKQPLTTILQKNVKPVSQNLKPLSAVGHPQKGVSGAHNSSSSHAVTTARSSSSSHAVGRNSSSSKAAIMTRNSTSSPALSSTHESSSSPTISLAHDSSSSSGQSPVTVVNSAMSQSWGVESFPSPVESVPKETGEKGSETIRDRNERETDETNAKFHLLRDGSSLKLPSEFGKALAANHRLRERLKAHQTANPKKLREGESSSENFMIRLQKHMEDSAPDAFSVGQNCRRQNNVSVWLRSLLDRVNALNISDETPAIVLFQAQKVVDFVLREFCSQEDEIHQSSMPRNLPPGQNTNLKVRHKESMLRWFSPSREDGDCCSEGQLAPSARISYQTPDQLQKYTTLVHEIQLVQLQTFLLEEAGNQMIKLLKQLNPNDRLFRELYRASYSLICSLGQSFPSVVQNIEDDAAEEEKDAKGQSSKEDYHT